MVGANDIHREHGYHALRVRRITQETDDTRTFVLDVPAELVDLFHYRAGQFCTFRVRVDGAELLRSYSMSTAPETDAELAVTVKRVRGGVVSNWLHDRVADGDTLEVTKPAGVFCVRDNEQPLLAFCGGSGVTPVLSIAKSVLATTGRRVRVFYANRDRRSVIFEEELRRLEKRHPEQLEVRHHYDSDAGFPDPRVITEFVGETLDADCYVCGPEPFMDLVEGTLYGVGVPGDRILIERFNLVTEPTAPVDQDDVPAEVTLILKGKKTTVAYVAGDTVLETARRAGLTPPFSCTAGNCATCMAILRSGKATMRVNDALTDSEVDEGWILTCQALPEGPGSVTVEYETF